MASAADLTGISERLKSARALLRHAQAAMAPILGLSVTQLKRLELGANVPSGETLLKYRELGFNPTWILTGEGPMRAEDGHGGPKTQDAAPQITAPELMALITDAIQHAYKDAGAGLSALDLGRLAAETYNDILASVPDREDWRGAVRMMAAQLRKNITATGADPAHRKRPAS